MSQLDSILGRLEKLAGSEVGQEGANGLGSDAVDMIERLGEKIKEKEASKSSNDLRHIDAFDTFVKDAVTPFVNLCGDVGVTEYSSLGDLGDRTQKTMEHIKRAIVFASKNKKPSSQQEIVKIFYYITKDEKEWDDIRFESKGLDEYDHYNSCWEAFKTAKWVLIRDAPFSYIKDCMEQTDFYTMKVLKKFRKKDPAHGDWVRALKNIINGMHDYVKEYHMTGLKWNPKGR